MFDITYFTLIDAAVPLEDITTPAGRLWSYGVLNNCHETPGVTGVVWGRDTKDPSVVLLVVELEEEHEEQRPNLAKASSFFDVYLQYPRTHQCLFDCDNSRLVEQQESLFLVFSFCYPHIDLSPELVDWKIQQKGIQDFPRTVRVNGTLSQNTRVYGARSDDTETYLLYNTHVNKRTIRAYHNRFADPRVRPPEAARFAHVHYHLVKLTKSLIMEPLYESPFLHNPSHLFSRTKERYGTRIVGDCDIIEVHGPTLPSISTYDCDNAVCFEPGAYAAPSPRNWPRGVWEYKGSKGFSFWETASLEFLDEVPNMNDRTSPSGLAWQMLRKLLSYADGAVSIHVATYPRFPNKTDIFIEWKDEMHSANFFTSEEYETAIDALVPSLQIERERSMRIDIVEGIPFDMNPIPVDSSEWMDIVDFIFRPDMTETDKRAFEYLMIQFSDCSCVDDAQGIGHPLFMNERHDHWIEEDERLIYRQEFYWDFEEENEVMAWMKKYLEHGYYELGISAHAIALMVEERRHLRVKIDHLNRMEHFGVM